jgi:hypothetical protein
MPPAAAAQAPGQGRDEAVLTFSLSLRITAEDVQKLEGDQLQQLLAFAERMRG